MGDENTTASLHELIEAQRISQGRRVYLEDARSDRVVTYAELAARTAGWRHVFAGAGVAPRAPVLLDIDDPLDFAVCYLSVIAAGRCAVPIDPAMPDGEFARALATLRPSAVIGSPRGAAWSGATPAGIVHFDPDQTLPAHHDDEGGAPGQLALRTSGSTGEPKIVELTERQLLHVARSVATHHRLTPDDRGFNPLPLFHINGEVVALLATLVAGATLVLDRRFHRDGFWPLIARRQITWINAVPAILTILSRDPILAPASLRLVRSASAPLPDAVRVALSAALGEIVVESYGMTEAASQITATRAGERSPAGSAGQPVGVELQIRRDSGQLAARGEIGRVWLRGRGVITRYMDGRAPERFDAAGWLDTGDLGRLDADGYLFLAGRTDDVINRGGQLVYPREIEEVLLGDDAITDAIVVGRPDDILGAVPIAYVIARDPEPVTAAPALIAGLEQRCRDQLSRYKRPAVIELVNDLPRAATGKVRRHEVRRAAMSAIR